MSDNLLQPIDTTPQPQLDHESQLTPIPQRNFWLAVGAQFAILATVAAPAIYTLHTGTTVFLQTAPVNLDYWMRSGNTGTLSYDIADRAKLAKLPGGKIFSDKQSLSATIIDKQSETGEFFVTLALPSAPGQKAAKPIAVSNTRPTNLLKNQIAIQGTRRQEFEGRNEINYGIKKFYMHKIEAQPEPKAQKDTENSNIDRNPRKLLVEVKIDNNGHPVLVRSRLI